MSRPWRKTSACHGKKVYLTWSQAARDAKLTRLLHKDQYVEPYRCRWCQKFHLGGRQR